MTNESRPRMMPVHSLILQVQQNLRDAEKRIEELTKERDEALKQLESIENELQTVDEIAETPTHFVLLGTPGAHNCDQMGCGYSHVLFRVEKKALPGWTALDLMNERQRLEWSRAENAEAKVDELTTALHQLIAQINSSASVISDSLRQDGDAYAANVSTLTALVHMRDDVLKVLDNAAENVALLQQVAEMQEALNMQIKTFDAMKLNSDRALENWMNTCAESDKRIDEFTKQLADIQAAHHSAMFLLDEAQSDCNGWHDAYVALLKWSQAAYKRLNELNGIRVPNVQEDAITALLVAAPANVSAEVDPFSAELDGDLNCTEKDVYEYAVDSVGASGIKTIEGCHSAGLHSCCGDLWTCTGCGNRFCDAEGSTDKIELCNDCWFKAQGEAK